jgi:hypothetical protein
VNKLARKLIVTRNWQSGFRDEMLGCGASLPSSSCRVTLRLSCSQAINRPWKSRVSPFARFVGSWNSDTPLPGSYFIRLLLWMSLNNR